MHHPSIPGTSRCCYSKVNGHWTAKQLPGRFAQPSHKITQALITSRSSCVCNAIGSVQYATSFHEQTSTEHLIPTTSGHPLMPSTQSRRRCVASASSGIGANNPQDPAENQQSSSGAQGGPGKSNNMQPNAGQSGSASPRRSPQPTPQDSNQADRLRNFMASAGMNAMPGMGIGASIPAQGQAQGQQRNTGGNFFASLGLPGFDGTDYSNTTQADRLRKLMQNVQEKASKSLSSAQAPRPPPPPPPPGPNGNGNGKGSRAMNSNGQRMTVAQLNEWGGDWTEDWDPEEDLDAQSRRALADQAEAESDRIRREQAARGDAPRDKWITPLLDLRAVTGAIDPDQERTEERLQGEALANKDESQTAIRYIIQLVTIPLVTGFILSRALADPILNFTLQNNSEAFAMTDRQKIEGAQKVHIEEARLRFDMAIGKIRPLDEDQILEHLREFAMEIQEEERHANEQNLITVVSDSISSIVLFSILTQQTRGRQAVFSTMSRLFDGLSDIAKAVMIILIADTLLGYHSEEGWTGLVELLAGHYGFEPNEEALVIFIGVIPVVIDVFFKYWIFIGLNKISPGAVVTIKQIDTH